jgi:hypothetical protein
MGGTREKMRSRKLLMGILVMILAFGVMLAGCADDPDEPATYTVWISTFAFSSDNSEFGTLQDGYYRTVELTNTGFDRQKADNFQNKPPYVWTENQLYNYLVEWGFGKTIAKEVAAWLTTVNHGYIVTREGETLQILLK